MALFMDIHHMDGGVSIDDVAKAHQADLATQGDHDVQYLRYWVDEAQGKIFCLGEALTSFRALGDQWGIAAALSTRAKLAMIRGDPATVHRDAHGLVADEIYRVEEGV